MKNIVALVLLGVALFVLPFVIKLPSAASDAPTWIAPTRVTPTEPPPAPTDRPTLAPTAPPTQQPTVALLQPVTLVSPASAGAAKPASVPMAWLAPASGVVGGQVGASASFPTAGVRDGATPVLMVMSFSPAPSLTPTATLTPTARYSPTPSSTPTSTFTPRPTHTPTPSLTPTRTPVFVLLSDKTAIAQYITPTYTPTPSPTAIPAVLLGKIGFRSNLFGKARVFVVDPDGSNLALLTNWWPYDAVFARQRTSPDGRHLVYQAQGREGLDLFLGPTAGGHPTQLTFVGRGKAFDAVWSPAGDAIAFASNQEGDDDIFVVQLGNPDAPHARTAKLTDKDDWESDKCPSYSPDGSQIVFFSNRSGREQLWVMNADGSNPHQILQIEADCYDPVWFKPAYANP